MPDPVRMSPQTLLLLEALLSDARAWRYGYDLSRETHLKSGTLYPVLVRLCERGWLETNWDTSQPGRPPRHLYRLTEAGLKEARAEFRKRRASPSLNPAAARGGAR
jgi:PadR family transcriptional regulator, regulatory protein PadR